jgi:hypothetical protein
VEDRVFLPFNLGSLDSVSFTRFSSILFLEYSLLYLSSSNPGEKIFDTHGTGRLSGSKLSIRQSVACHKNMAMGTKLPLNVSK